MAALAARHPLAPARVLGAYPDQRPLTIQALRQLMCPPAGAAAGGRAAQGPPWAGRWRGRWRGLRERLLRLWATARAAAQELPRLRAKGRASRAPPAGGSAACGAALPGARTGSKQWLLGSSARDDDAVRHTGPRGWPGGSGRDYTLESAESRAAPGGGATRSLPQSADKRLPPRASRWRASPERASRQRRARCCSCTAAGSRSEALPPGSAARALEAWALPFRVPRAGGTRHGRMGHSRYWPSISHDWSLNTPISHMVAGSTGACGLTATSCRGKRGTLLRWRRRYAVGMRTRQRSGSPITLGIGVGWGGGDTQLAGPRTSPLLHLSPLY